jgi:hypothetical protein
MNGVQDHALTWRDWLMLTVIIPPMFFGALWIFGSMIDGYGSQIEQREHCLRHSIDALDARRCH